MKKNRWILSIFSIVIISLIVVTGLMYWSDTYSIAHEKRIKFYTEPNKNILKVKYILNNKEKYDSFIFGSSRVGYINPLKINDAKYFNMTYSEGIPKEHLLNIKLFINSGVKIENLLIGLDEFSYQVSYDSHQSQGLTKSYYLASGINIFLFFKDYFFRYPLGEDRSHIVKKIKNSKKYYNYDISKQEEYYNTRVDNFSKDNFNSTEHLNSSKFNKPTHYNVDYLFETVRDVKDIKDLCNLHNINCSFFINPIHKTTYNYTNKELLNNFRYNLSLITPYYDFSIPSEISNNNQYWLETSHYNLEVGDMILNRIYDNNTSIKDFGIYINKKITKDKTN